MQKKLLVTFLSLMFIVCFSVDADAQNRRKKKKYRERPPKTEQTEERSSSTDETRSQRSGSSSERSSRSSNEGVKGFSTDKLVYDIMGDFRIPFRTNQATVLKFGLKPAVAYKIWPRFSMGIAAKTEYYFWSIVDEEDDHEFDFGIEPFARFLIFESVYLQAGYEFNNSVLLFPRRTWNNTPVLGGGYMSGFGPWKYGIQALLNLNEERADLYGLVQVWFGVTYNL